jgi:hypothetical protein
MNKLLTTIILLCFSVAANADIYFCTVEKTVDKKVLDIKPAYVETNAWQIACCLPCPMKSLQLETN